MSEQWVVNASPLILLARIGREDLFAHPAQAGCHTTSSSLSRSTLACQMIQPRCIGRRKTPNC